MTPRKQGQQPRRSASPARAKSTATPSSQSPSRPTLTAPLAPKPQPRRLSRAAKLALVDEICRRFQKATPDPRCELYYKTDFQLLVSVVLSAQATDKSVNQSMRDAYDHGFTPDDVLRLGEAGVLKMIRRIGLAPTKAGRVVELARLLKERHGGQVPSTREELEALPGVGRKTANVVLAEIWREPTLAVDTHVYRVTRRLGLHDEKTAEKCELRLLDLVDRKYLPQAHHWLILHGRYTCKAIKPDCEHCSLKDICPSM